MRKIKKWNPKTGRWNTIDLDELRERADREYRRAMKRFRDRLKIFAKKRGTYSGKDYMEALRLVYGCLWNFENGPASPQFIVVNAEPNHAVLIDPQLVPDGEDPRPTLDDLLSRIEQHRRIDLKSKPLAEETELSIELYNALVQELGVKGTAILVPTLLPDPMLCRVYIDGIQIPDADPVEILRAALER